MSQQYLVFHETYYKAGKNGGWQNLFLADDEIRQNAVNNLKAFFPPQKPGIIDFGWINTQNSSVDPKFQTVLMKATSFDYLTSYTFAKPFWATFMLSFMGFSICFIGVCVATLLIVSYKKEKPITLEEPLIQRT